jgi:hypothetical protein
VSVTTTSRVDWATVDLAEHRWTAPLTDAEAGSEAWLAMRRPYANASTAAVHVREHEFESIAEWAARKITGEEVAETAKMRMGKMLEDALRHWYADETGMEWALPVVAYGVGRLLSNPDGLALRGPTSAPERVVYGLEIKSTDGATSRRSRYWQCVAGLVATGWDVWHLVELDYQWGKLNVTRIEWDAEVEADARRLLAAVDADWDWVDIGLIPEDAEITDDVAKMLTRKATEERRELPATTETLILTRQQLKAQVKAAEEALDLVNGALRMAFGGATEAWLPDGRKVGTYKLVNGTKLDREAIERDHPGLLAEYTRPNPYRAMNIAKAWDKVAAQAPPAEATAAELVADADIEEEF